MDFSELSQKFALVLRKYWVPFLIVVFGLIFLVNSLMVSLSNKPDILSVGAKDENVSRSAYFIQAKQITIDVEGAVINPGIYKLNKDATIQDALIAAGGLSSNADRIQVAKSLILASKVVDGGKIYIPFVGDTASAVGN